MTAPRSMTPAQQREVRQLSLDIHAIKMWWKLPADDNDERAKRAQLSGRNSSNPDSPQPKGMKMKFNVLNRWSGDLQFTAEIDCAEDTPTRIKLGLAVKWAYQSDAVLSGADLRGAVLSDALKGVPIVENLDSKILAAIEAPGNELNMGSWHTCETTHCRAGWAITLAGAGGAALEFALGSAAAGALIYAASKPGKKIPNFYADNATALEDIRRSAVEEQAAA